MKSNEKMSEMTAQTPESSIKDAVAAVVEPSAKPKTARAKRVSLLGAVNPECVATVDELETVDPKLKVRSVDVSRYRDTAVEDGPGF